MNEMTVTIIEQPGNISAVKAHSIAQMLVQYYRNASPDIREDIDRRAYEIRQRRNTHANPHTK